jgi:hypothetical protein
MTESLLKKMSELESRLPELEQLRSSDPFANDLYEAAAYWCGLGRWVLEKNTKVNHPERVRGELELLTKLRQGLQNKPAEDQRCYAPILETAHAILRTVQAVQPPRDGHLGVLRVIREHFQFLQTDYDFSIIDTQPTGLRFSSGAVYLRLEHAKDHTLSCVFGPETEPRESFWIDDLLFMNGDTRYRNLPQELRLDTEEEVENWFAFLADVFKQYGHPVLSDEPGIFTRLAQAQAERDAEYVRDMNRKFGGWPPRNTPR